MSNVIAICGAKRSGKDVLAKYIIEKYGFKKLSFAEPLKKAVKELFNFNDIQVGIDEENALGNEKEIIDERWGISPRKALQFFGTEIMQYSIDKLIPNTNRCFLADILLSHISDDKNGTTNNYVISDLRFLHEYNKLKSSLKINSLIIVKLSRPSINITEGTQGTEGTEGTQGTQGTQGICDMHISEKEYINIPHDVEIVNDGTIRDLTDLFDIYYDAHMKLLL